MFGILNELVTDSVLIFVFISKPSIYFYIKSFGGFIFCHSVLNVRLHFDFFAFILSYNCLSENGLKFYNDFLLNVVPIYHQ